MKLLKSNIVSAVFTLAGFGILCYGIWLLSHAAAYIVMGFLLVLLSVAIDRGKASL